MRSGVLPVADVLDAHSGSSSKRPNVKVTLRKHETWWSLGDADTDDTVCKQEARGVHGSVAAAPGLVAVAATACPISAIHRPSINTRRVKAYRPPPGMGLAHRTCEDITSDRP